MEQEKIKELLDRYYEGLTTEEEEATLKNYFGSQVIPGESSPEWGLFNLPESKAPDPSPDFEMKLEAALTGPRDHTGKTTIIRYVISVAAGLAILVASYYFLSHSERHLMKDTYSDPELALAEVKSILSTISKNMKTGTEPLKTMSKINIAPETLDNLGKMNITKESSLNKLQYLNKLDKTKENN